MEQIREYLEHHTVSSSLSMLEDEKEAITKQMQHLQKLQKNVEHRLNTIHQKTKLLAEACSQANDAEYVIATIDSTWGTDIANAIGNKLIESTVSGTDVNAKFEELKSELIGLIG